MRAKSAFIHDSIGRYREGKERGNALFRKSNKSTEDGVTCYVLSIITFSRFPSDVSIGSSHLERVVRNRPVLQLRGG